MAGALADIYAAVRLVLDAQGFQAQAEATGSKAGKSVGEKMSKELNAKLSRGMAAGGAAIGAGFGFIASQGAKLDDVMADLSSDTGIVGDELTNARKALGEMLGNNNIVPLEQLGETMQKVHDDLGLSGDAMDASTAKFAKYEQATKQGADAVTDFDDILDAWNLTADQAPAIMDKLIASHQKYGGSLSANQKALAAMAPAMQAANMSIDDGIGLLNLFAASGIDASKAPAMLAKAVRSLKPGQSLNDLIAQIASIQDPTLRAQKAMELFGAKAGIGMAQALKPGMTGLSDFSVSADEAAGATDRAADAAISWQDRGTAMFNALSAKAGEFGQQFGPLLMVAGQLGPKLSSAFGGVFGALGGKAGSNLARGLLGSQGAVTSATDKLATGAGRSFGSKLGTLAKAGIIAALAVGAVELANMVGDLANQANRDALDSQSKELATRAAKMTTEELKSFIDQVRPEMARIPAGVAATIMDPLESELESRGAAAGTAAVEGIKEGVTATIDGVAYTMKKAADGSLEAVPIATNAAVTETEVVINGHKVKVRQAADGTFGQVTDAAKAAGAATVAATKLGMLEVVSEITQGKDALVSAYSGAIDETARAQQIGLEKQLLQQQLADDRKELASKKLTATERLELQQRILNAQVAYEKLVVEETKYGTRAEQVTKTQALLNSKALLDGLNDKDPEIAAMWRGVKEKAEEQLQALENDAPGYAERTGSSYADALTNAETIRKLNAAMDVWRATIAGKLPGIAVNPYTGFTVTTGGVSPGTPAPKGNTNPLGDRARSIPSHAAGLPRVPVDNYLMYAHADEAVLTKAQAQDWRAGPRTTNIYGVPIRDAKAGDDIAVAMRRAEAFG